VNIIVFGLMAISGVSWLDPPTDSLVQWGANYGPMTLGDQSWRMLTSLFLHIGIIHLLLNMLVLANIGPAMETLLGSVAYVILYLVAGLAGSAASLAWHPLGVSAGASGAIFGLYGALIAFWVRGSAHREILLPLWKGAVAFVAINLFFGFFQPGVDLAAHFGGLTSGFLLGLFLVQPTPQNAVAGRRWRNAVASIAGVALVLATLAILPKPDDFLGEIKRYSKVESNARQLVNSSIEKARSNQLDDEQMLRLLEQQVLPNWNAEREALTKLKRLPDEQQRFVTLLIAYMTAREESWHLLAEGVCARDLEKITKANQTNDEAEKLLDRINGGPQHSFGKQTAEDFFLQGVTKDKAGDLDGAIADCDRALQLNPNFAAAYNCRGTAKDIKGDIDGAITDLNQAIQVNPKDADAYHELVAVYGTRGEMDKAEIMADKAVALYKTSGNQEGMAKVYGVLGTFYQKRGETNKAEAAFSNTLALFEALGNKEGEAVADRSLGTVYSGCGELDKAEAVLNKSLALFESLKSKENLSVGYGLLGGIYQNRGELDKAEAMYKKALAVAESLGNKVDVATAYFSLGIVYYSRGNWDGAIADFGRAIELNPNFANAYLGRGKANQLKDDFEGALNDFIYWSKIEPQGKNQDYPQLFIWILRSRIGQKAEANQELSAYLHKRLDISPNDWISKVGDFLLDKINGEVFFVAANSPDAAKSRGQHCEAWYYSGVKRLLAGDKKTASNYFIKCLETQETDFDEYILAKAELRRLATAN